MTGILSGYERHARQRLAGAGTEVGQVADRGGDDVQRAGQRDAGALGRWRLLGHGFGYLRLFTENNG